MSLSCIHCLSSPAQWRERDTPAHVFCSEICQIGYWTGDIKLPKSFRVRVITWNMGENKKSQLDWAGELRQNWEIITKQDYEVLFLTVQEDEGGSAFAKAVEGAIGKKYDLLIQESTSVPFVKFSIKGLLFTRSTLRPLLSSPKAEKTCLQSICTKSTVGMSLLIGEQVQLIFMGSHFPVDTKKADLGFDERVKAGEKSLTKVFNQLRDPKKTRFAAFWAGDLNFRFLSGTDQLSRAGRFGWSEEVITFPPTCKMTTKGTCDRKQSDKTRQAGCYEDKRQPSWCDRILYRGSSGLIVPGKYLSYSDAKAIQESDHNMVYGDFELNL